MARERKNADDVTALDISYSPDVSKLAEEVARTRKPKSLRIGDEEIARIVPATKRGRSTKHDPANLRAALEAAQEMWSRSGLDADDVIAEIYRAREEGSRPATRP
jgi:hypothetical protein